jgi:hypothetical protein
MKYLGVEIDEKLDFKQRVATTIKKMKKVGFLGRIQQKQNKTSKITIYSRIISPHIISHTVPRFYISRKRRILEPHADHLKQSNEDNIEVSLANSR